MNETNARGDKILAETHPIDRLQSRIEAYENTGAHNDALFAEFPEHTNRIPFLKGHRDWVDENDWGFGNHAFHYMWLLLLADAQSCFKPINLLEIGVFKGQALSLWAVIARELGIDVEITGISPFEGNQRRRVRWVHKLRKKLDPAYRKVNSVGGFYPTDDYLALTHEIFAHFDLDIAKVRLVHGYSTDAAVVKQVADTAFSIIYIDGEHSSEVVRSDVATYAPLVAEGGYIVMDDAGFFLPGETFPKGFEGVAKASENLLDLGFVNVLNVGHNRVFRKTAS